MIRQTSSVAVRLATTAVGRRLASTYLVFHAGITRVAGVTRITGEFERSLFSGRCEALRRRVADEMVALSNLFERGLLFWLLYYLRKIATPHRKGVRVTLKVQVAPKPLRSKAVGRTTIGWCTKSFWFRFLQKAERKEV